MAARLCYHTAMLGLVDHRETDWDTYWRWEIFRRRTDPLDWRRWKADSSRELRALPQGRDRAGLPPLILDATCGMGYHAMIQQELGFRVEACDANERALAEAQRLAASEGMSLPLFCATWQQLGQMRPERYDLVFNDEIHQVRQRSDLLAALRGIHGALQPGGHLVFFFSDEDKPDDGPNQARWEWEHGPPDSVAWTASGEGLQVTMIVLRQLCGSDAIWHHHVYLVQDRSPDGPRVESLTMTRNYHWDWARMVQVLNEAGFDQVICHHRTNVHGRTYTMNLARRG